MHEPTPENRAEQVIALEPEPRKMSDQVREPTTSSIIMGVLVDFEGMEGMPGLCLASGNHFDNLEEDVSLFLLSPLVPPSSEFLMPLLVLPSTEFPVFPLVPFSSKSPEFPRSLPLLRSLSKSASPSAPSLLSPVSPSAPPRPLLSGLPSSSSYQTSGSSDSASSLCSRHSTSAHLRLP